ncbi:MAG TPA: NAD(+) synthase [Ktedonobacteraceae bacterium]|jgi:NAD+ synthase
MVQNFSAAREAESLISWLRATHATVLRRNGGIVGVSGGIDSATVLHLAARALGSQQVVALVLPDRDSSPVSASLALDMAARLGVQAIQIDLSAVLQAYGCYELRDQAIQHAIPEFSPRHDKAKIVLPENLLAQASLNIFSAIVVKPDGQQIRRRLSVSDLRQIVAASNIKQRVRMTRLYYEAERRNFSVIGTANKNEYDLGFFVKYGDGGADLLPLRHLFKTQIYALADYLGVPEAIVQRAPTTDTYSAECSQEEFFYRLPFAVLDSIWQAHERQDPPAQIARALGLQIVQVEHVLHDLQRKKHTTEYLRLDPITASEH